MHRLAVVTAVATFVLLLIGSVVHSTGSGLACPDWSFIPLCHGQVLPPMQGGVFYEHGHRLFATGVGLLTIALTVLTFRNRKADPFLAKLGIAALVIVCVQGVLGGLTVLYQLPVAVSSAHLGTSMLVLCLFIYIAYRARPPGAKLGAPAPLRRWLGIALALTYVQILVGALVRHMRAGLACLDWPFCQGELWPAETSLGKLHMVHRMVAIVVAALVLFAAIRLARATRGKVRALALAACAVIALQVTLGVLSVTSYLALVIITAHLGVGALLLALLWILWLLTIPGRAPVSATETA